MRVNYSLPEKLIKEVGKAAEKHGCFKSSIVERAIKEYLLKIKKT